MYSHTTCHVKHAHKERYIWRKIRKGNSIKAIKFVIGKMRVLLIANFLGNLISFTFHIPGIEE